jgi:hypothetical protein
MTEAVTTCHIRSANIPANTRVEILPECNHDWETGRLRIAYNMATYLVPERMLKEVLSDEKS